MKKIIGLLLLVVLFSGCSNNNNITGESVKDSNELEIEKQESLFTKKLSTKSEDVELSLTENKLTGKTSVNMVFKINDTIYTDETMCFKSAVSLSVALMRDMIFNSSSIMYEEQNEPLTDFNFRNYDINKFRTDFIRKETGQSLGYVEFYSNNPEDSSSNLKADFLEAMTNSTKAEEMLMLCIQNAFESAFEGTFE